MPAIRWPPFTLSTAADVCIALQNDRGVPSRVDDSRTDTSTGIAIREGSAPARHAAI